MTFAILFEPFARCVQVRVLANASQNIQCLPGLGPGVEDIIRGQHGETMPPRHLN